MLVEPQQIPGELAADHGAGQSLRAGADHRAAADDAGEPARARRPGRALRRPAGDVGRRAWSATCASASSSSASAPTRPAGPTDAGRHHHRRRLRGADAGARQQGRQRAGQPGAAGERQAAHRPGRRHAASSSRPRSSGWRASSSASPRRSPPSRPRTSRRCPTAWTPAAPSRSASRSGCSTLEREEAALRNQRATVVWVFERTGRSSRRASRSAPRRRSCRSCTSELIQQQAIYRPGSPTHPGAARPASRRSRGWSAEQQAARALPDAEGAGGGAA